MTTLGKKSIALKNWVQCTSLTLKGTNFAFGSYFEALYIEVRGIFDRYSQVYEIARYKVLAVEEKNKLMDAKLLMLIMKFLPERVKEVALRENALRNAADLIMAILGHVMPGGDVEVNQLLEFARNPRLKEQTPMHGRAVIEDWVEARKRLKELGHGDVVPTESLRALDKITVVLESDPSAKQRYSLSRYGPESRSPTHQFVDSLVKLAAEEIRLLIQRGHERTSQQSTSKTKWSTVNAIEPSPKQEPSKQEAQEQEPTAAIIIARQKQEWEAAADKTWKGEAREPWKGEARNWKGKEKGGKGKGKDKCKWGK